MNAYIDRLVEMGFLIPNPDAEWHAAPLLVPKPNSRAEFRMTVDLRPVNAATKKESWPMPHLESELQDFAGSACFASLDFCSGYWQCPLDKDSWNACGIVCPKGVYSATRTLQGLTNAVKYFQSTVEPLFFDLRHYLKAWLDDFNLHAKDEAVHLRNLRQFFEICKEKNLFLSAKKCEFFAKNIRWCGRIISKDGYCMDPRNAEALRDLQLPTTADELCEFVHCCRWMSVGIPDFQALVEPLVLVLNEAHKQSGRKTKRSIKGMQLRQLGWNKEHITSFYKLQEALKESVKLSYPKAGKIICVYTDASDRFWYGVVSQTDENELKKPLHLQSHEPLAFTGGVFKKAEANWNTFEKEGFAIFQTFDCLDYLFLDEHPVHLFTDHRNLLYTFAPMALQPAMKRHAVSKVQRWAIFLSKFEYIIEHVDGSQNIFADILTRWTKGYRGNERVATSKICSLLLDASCSVPSTDDVEWPSIENMKAAQARFASHVPPDAKEDSWYLSCLWSCVDSE